MLVSSLIGGKAGTSRVPPRACRWPTAGGKRNCNKSKDMSNETALSATDLRKSFSMGEETVEVIKDLTFSLPKGAFEAVMGPSGSGKSTILHLLAGLLAPDSGTITIGGQNIGHMTDCDLTVFRRRRIGLIFQDFNLIP